MKKVETTVYHTCHLACIVYKREERSKVLALEMDYLRRSGSVSRLQKKISNSTIGAKCKQNNLF